MKRSYGLQVAKWGNSLAIRLPAALAQRTGIREGDTLTIEEAPDGTLQLRSVRAFDRKAFAMSLEKAASNMPLGESVMEEVRRG